MKRKIARFIAGLGLTVAVSASAFIPGNVNVYASDEDPSSWVSEEEYDIDEDGDEDIQDDDTDVDVDDFVVNAGVPEIATAADAQLSKTITLEGVKAADGSDITIDVSYTSTVGFNGRKHVIAGTKAGKKDCADLNISYNSAIFEYADASFKYVANKNASIDDQTSCFYFKLKSKKNATKAQKADVKKANKILKQLPNRCYFTITPYMVTGNGDVYVKMNKKRTKVTSVVVTIDGKNLKLKKKKDYDAQVLVKRAALTFKGNYCNAPITKDVSGVWEGEYRAAQGVTSLKLEIQNSGTNGELTAVFNFGPHPKNKKVPNGSYTMKGTYDPEEGKVYLTGVEWIEHPNTYHFLSVNGFVGANGMITGNTGSYTGLKLIRTGDIE